MIITHRSFNRYIELNILNRFIKHREQQRFFRVRIFSVFLSKRFVLSCFNRFRLNDVICEYIICSYMSFRAFVTNFRAICFKAFTIETFA